MVLTKLASELPCVVYICVYMAMPCAPGYPSNGVEPVPLGLRPKKIEPK